jgi:hypothetical protein
MKRYYGRDQVYFPLPAFALMGNWCFELYFKPTATTQNSTTCPVFSGFVSSLSQFHASLTKELFFACPLSK